MKKLTLAATLVAVLVAPGLIGVANAASGDDTIFGRDKVNVEQSLADRGIAVTSVEQWGQVIAAFVKGDDGTETMQFFDKDSLQAVRPGGAAIHSGLASDTTPYGRGDFGSSNESLVD